MTTRCEDAPCCGCCGTNLYGGNENRDYYDEQHDPEHEDFYQGEPAECEDDHDCQDCERTDEGWVCSWCDRPCPIETHDQEPAQW